jgi:hypothetical protein
LSTCLTLSSRSANEAERSRHKRIITLGWKFSTLRCEYIQRSSVDSLYRRNTLFHSPGKWWTWLRLKADRQSLRGTALRIHIMIFKIKSKTQGDFDDTIALIQNSRTIHGLPGAHSLFQVRAVSRDRDLSWIVNLGKTLHKP